MAGVLVARAGSPDFALTHVDAAAAAMLGDGNNGVTCGGDLFAALACGADVLPLADVLRTGVRDRAACAARLIVRTPGDAATARRITFTPVDVLDTCAQTLVVVDDENRVSGNQAPVPFASAMGVVAHELRSPLNAALIWISLLDADRSPTTIDRAVAVIKQSVVEQTQLIDDLLELAESPDTRYRVHAELVALHALIDETVELLRARLPATVRLDYAAEPVELAIDPERVRHLIRHLVAHAVRSMPKGGTIGMHLRCVDGSAVLSVTDQGARLNTHQLGESFRLFSRAATDVTPVSLANGVVQMIVARLGGSVCICSASGGNTFAISLPLS